MANAPSIGRPRGLGPAPRIFAEAQDARAGPSRSLPRAPVDRLMASGAGAQGERAATVIDAAAPRRYAWAHTTTEGGRDGGGPGGNRGDHRGVRPGAGRAGAPGTLARRRAREACARRARPALEVGPHLREPHAG